MELIIWYNKSIFKSGEEPKMAELDNSVYEKFYSDAEVVKLMARTEVHDNLEMDYHTHSVKVGLLATLLKFNHLVEFFKKISRELANEYFGGNYKELNSILNDDGRELLTAIFADRNYISHMISEDALVNPPWELRMVNEYTKKKENI